MDYRKFRRFLPHTALLMLLVLAVAGYAQGFRLNRFGFSSPGTLSVLVPLAGSEVFLDGQKEKTTATSSETILFDSLAAGKHTVLVGKDGYWPWQKTLRVESRSAVAAYPFHVRKDASGIIITDKDPEYQTLVQRIRNEAVPTAETRRVSADKSVAAWAEGGVASASFLLGKNRTPAYFCPEGACVDTLTVYSARDAIRSLDFYPGRADVILLAFLNGIYAVEIDAAGMQNFQPVYKGALPSFVLSGHGTLFVEDAGHLYEIGL